VTDAVQFAGYEPRAAAAEQRCVEEHQSLLLMHTQRARQLDAYPALSQAALLDRALDLLGVEGGCDPDEPPGDSETRHDQDPRG
jgi:hypothetical protein